MLVRIDKLRTIAAEFYYQLMQTGYQIVMNGSMLDDEPSGVGVYSYNVINHLSTLYAREHRHISVFTPTRRFLNQDVRVIKLPNIIQSSRYGKLAACFRFLWNTFYFPFQSRHYELKISTTTHGSLLRNNQVITIHDLLSLRYNNISAHQRLYFKWVLPFMISRSRMILTVSETTKRDIIKFFHCDPNKIKVVHNGYEEKRYFPLTYSTNYIQTLFGCKDYFLAVGPTYPHKNFETLMEAYSKLDPSIRSMHPLVIAGGKPKYRRSLEAVSTRLGISDEVHFVGYVPLEHMASLYREAIMLVFPSLYEGFGIPLLEAMASGCPVVCSNTSSMPEVCGDAAAYFDPTSIADMREAMDRLVHSEKDRVRLREKGLIRVKDFSWTKTAEAIKLLIETNILKNTTL